MQTIKYTFTGIDQKTNVSDLLELKNKSKNEVEFGILYSPKLAGQPGKYPPLVKIFDFIDILGSNSSVHICGVGILNIFNNMSDEIKILNMINDVEGRIQLNFNFNRCKINKEDFFLLFNKYKKINFITQENFNNSSFTKDSFIENHHILFDSSGGNGVLAENWPNYIKNKYCGYAGGLGPKNIALQIIFILGSAKGNSFWLDMESKIRSFDDNYISWFDVEKVSEVISILNKHPIFRYRIDEKTINI